jgi:uncharacterized protein YkwD
MKTPALHHTAASLLTALAWLLALHPAPLRADFPTDVLTLTNKERQKANLAPLAMNPILTAAAQAHAEDMANKDYFSHTGLDGSNETLRVTRIGGVFTGAFAGAAENLAVGPATPAAVVASWMASPGHRDNILNPSWTLLGVGYFFLPKDSGKVAYGHYWAQNFAASLDGSINTVPATVPSTSTNLTLRPGQSFSLQLTTAKPAASYKPKSKLPPGVKLAKTTGLLTGKIKKTGSYKLIILARHTDGSTTTLRSSLRVKN